MLARNFRREAAPGDEISGDRKRGTAVLHVYSRAVAVRTRVSPAKKEKARTRIDIYDGRP